MNAQIPSARRGAGPLPRAAAAQAGRAYATLLPTTALLAGALPHVDWSDACAVTVPSGVPERDAQAWSDAIFRGPPPWIRVLFGVREVVVRVVGIEPGGSHVFATVSRRTDEVLVGTDQGHLGFRASVLTEPGRVVLSTVVQLRNRRGRVYFAVVRRLHPWVVRGMLTRAARQLAVAS
jgi:hypothetical protein